jgi:hypothetical protein
MRQHVLEEFAAAANIDHVSAAHLLNMRTAWREYDLKHWYFV